MLLVEEGSLFGERTRQQTFGKAGGNGSGARGVGRHEIEGQSQCRVSGKGHVGIAQLFGKLPCEGEVP